ncbi:MAG: lipid IV(A) 3-deoxy-D-manno-octulosonic acid transferase [Pseudomonadota bacterium]
MRFIYTSVFYLAIPFILLRLLWRAFAAPAYARRWSERFGFFPSLVKSRRDPGNAKKIVWVHTVSVGEFIAALPIIKHLQTNPALQLVVTTTTPTGSDRVRAMLGDSVFHVYAPYDLPDVIARFLQRIKPSLLLIMETELWPNTIAACTKRNIPVVLVNGRMSKKSARGYQKFSALTRPMLQNMSLVLVQNKEDAARFNNLGLRVESTQITGNIKFDLVLTDELLQQAVQLKQLWNHNRERLIWIAASTHLGEDEIILEAFRQLRPQLKKLLLVLVPRHPERFNSVHNLCVSRGFNVAKRSLGDVRAATDIIVGDTMGELLLLFGASDIAFVGGSLVPNGGHNFIEPAAWQLPLLSGLHVFNFAEVARLLQEAGALTLVSTANELAEQIRLLVLDDRERDRRGMAALRVANENRGALEKALNAINMFIK